MKYYMCRCKCGYEMVLSEEELKTIPPPSCPQCEPEKYCNNECIIKDVYECEFEPAG